MDTAKKVLVIDDNILDVMEVEKYLLAAGYEVSKLASAHGCVAKLDYERPDILLVDIAMKHLNAQELFDSIRHSREHEELIVVLFSDLEAETLQSICVEHDFHGYFSKSIGLDQIGAFLDNFYREA
ncbi:MAG: response regulator [Bradymonadales bacterium]|nr:response regulator [Bradymonadales bacterium]